MRAIRYVIVSFLSLIAAGSALAQTRVSTAASPQKSAAEQVCDTHFAAGSTYHGYEYRDGRNISVTITYTYCTDMPATHGRMKLQAHFDRQESGAAFQKGQYLEFYVDSVMHLEWRNMSGHYKEKSRKLVFNADRSYHEHLVYMSGTPTTVHFKRMK